MLAEKLYQKLDQQEINVDQLATLMPEDPELLRAVIDGLYMESPRVNYPCAIALQIVSSTQPRQLYANFNSLVDLLKTSAPLIKIEIINILANLAKVDTQGKIDNFLDTYFEPLEGPSLLAAMSVVKGALRLIAAKPRLGEQIAEELLRVEIGEYENEEARRIIYKEVLDALQEMNSQPFPFSARNILQVPVTA